MNEHPDNLPSRDEQALPVDVAGLGRLLDARGSAQRDALSAEALERITAISDLQLPIQGADSPVVIARIGPSEASRREAVRRFWRIAAAVAVIVGIGGAAVLAVRGFNGSEPAPGTLVDGSRPGLPAPSSAPGAAPGSGSGAASGAASNSGSKSALAVRPLAAEHLEHALASQSRSAAAVVVALSNPSNEPSIHYPDMDDALAADIAPLFQAGSLLDGGGMTYEDLSGEFAALVAPGSFH